jgi:UDPglucose--hexose-1-phosphate uridylyltransferase
MSQLRLDPLTGRWVVIAGERAVRPSAWRARALAVEDDPDRPCPFCPGHEHLEDGEEKLSTLHSYGPDAGHRLKGTDRADAEAGWWVRVVENRYPAFVGHEPMVVTHLGPVFTQATASGIHEVFVLTPDHQGSWADLSAAHSAVIMEALCDRMAEHAAIPGLRYSQAVVNHGREAGASLAHPHGQLLSIPFVPGEMASELAGFARFQGNCLLCAVADAEESARHRIVQVDDEVAVVCPFWSGTPYEMLVIPRRHEPHLYQARGQDLAAVGSAIQQALAALRDRVGDIAYNVMFHSAPYRLSGDYHWHAHIVPKATTRGGFELGSGVLINVVEPEEAARELRVQPAAVAG